MKKLSMAVAVSSIALVAPGLAAADTFNYASVKGGWAQVRDTHFDLGVDGNDIDTRIETSYDDGFVGGVAFGRQYDEGRSFNVRAEVEIGYQMADVDRHTEVRTDVSDEDVPRPDGTDSVASPEGDFSTLYGFASVYGERDLNILPELSFIFGAGVGLGLVEFDGYGPDADGNALMDDSDIGFGYHLTTGWSYDVADRIALEATYRYMAFEDVGFEAENGKSTRQRIDSHNFMAGVRFGF